MSLEKIDEYIKQIKAIRDYDRLSQELQKTRSELAKQSQINYFHECAIDSLTSKIDVLSNNLREKQNEVERLSITLASKNREIEGITKELDYFKKQATK